MTTSLARSLYFAFLLSAFSFAVNTARAQDSTEHLRDWHLMDRQQDGINGTSVTKAYRELLKNRKSYPVIVAVIDLGMDTAQEDLQGHIWTNLREIPGNGIDDDHNGYVDDVHGWNFLGGADGRNIIHESLESYREYYRLQPVYGNDPGDGKYKDTTSPGGKADRQQYAYWLKIRGAYARDTLLYQEEIRQLLTSNTQLEKEDTLLRKASKRDTIYVADLEKIKTTDTTVSDATRQVLEFYRTRGEFYTRDMSLERVIAMRYAFAQESKDYLMQLNGDPNAQRHDIVKDDPDNIDDRTYGNNNISAGYPDHGTHVSGIIAAIRGNGIGMDGITDKVIIMPVRAACLGDERDKDVALAIRYAVDNGAKIINMSFGKYFSPGKRWVDDAVKYAGKKGVLLVHGAGNESTNLDSTNDYPNALILSDGRTADNFINVGASDRGPDSALVADFSNYGNTQVDLFAPGVNIYSSIPGNKYAKFSGTSMAAPVVAGVAALVLSYYPKLSAGQLKYILVHSVMKLPGKQTLIPGGSTKVEFPTLSSSGGIVNAYNALKLASALTGRRSPGDPSALSRHSPPQSADPSR